MKRALFGALAFTFAVSSSQAGWRGQEPEMTAGEFLCGILGGLAGGKIAHSAGASDPMIFGAALLGGAVASSFCSYLRDEEKQSLIPIMNQSLDLPVGGAREVRTEGFRSFVNIRNECWKTGFNSDSQTENTCKLFEASVYRSNMQFLGRSKEWACKNEQGQWVITNQNWIPVDKCRKGPSQSGYGSSNGNSSTHSQQSSGSYAGSVEAPVVSANTIVLGWDARQIPRKVSVQNGSRTEVRAPLLMNRRTEIGFFGGSNQDGSGVYFYLNPEPQTAREARLHSVEDVGIECGVTVFCQSRYVKTAEGLEGQIRFLFRNGDVGVKTSQGWKISPLSTLR